MNATKAQAAANPDLETGNPLHSHKPGQDNVRLLGLDMHNPVFFVSAGLVLLFCAGAIIFPNRAELWLGAAKQFSLEYFDWFFVISSNIIVLFCIFLAISSFGKIRLGGKDAKPEFGTLSWLAMLFSAGVGIGMVFYGAAEPMAYFTDWGGTPLGVAAGSEEAEKLALSATIFHWGLTPWAIYALMGVSLAFFAFNRNLPLTIRSIFYPLLGERTWGWPGHIIDILAVVATIFGLATSLGFGAMQASSGIDYLSSLESGLQMHIILIIAISGLAIISVVRGLDGGIKLLSNANMLLAIGLLLFVFIAGPTLAIVSGMGKAVTGYIQYAIPLSNWIDRPDKVWYHGWTIFYWAWWISWAPFVGMFIARISKGRTIREFMLAVMLMPLVVSTIWFSTFGVTAIEQVKANVGTLPAGIGDVSLVLFQMLENMPFAQIASAVAVILLVIFFVTSSDSGSLVIDGITAGGKTNGPVIQKIFWAVLQGLVAIALLVGGGSKALGSMQAGAVATGLPLTLVLLLCCFALFKALSREPR